MAVAAVGDINLNNSKTKPMEVTSPDNKIAEDQIAIRAYAKWCARGCPLWEEEQDWSAARAELQHEIGAENTSVAPNAQG